LPPQCFALFSPRRRVRRSRYPSRLLSRASPPACLPSLPASSPPILVGYFHNLIFGNLRNQHILVIHQHRVGTRGIEAGDVFVSPLLTVAQVKRHQFCFCHSTPFLRAVILQTTKVAHGPQRLCEQGVSIGHAS